MPVNPCRYLHLQMAALLPGSTLRLAAWPLTARVSAQACVADSSLASVSGRVPLKGLWRLLLIA